MTFVLAFASAFFYIAATLAMKQWSGLGAFTALVLIVITLAAAVVCEIIALRHERLSYIYVLILGIECVMAVLCSWYLLRENYGPIEILGLLLIITGIAVIHLPTGSGSQDETPRAARSSAPPPAAERPRSRRAPLTHSHRANPAVADPIRRSTARYRAF